MFNKYLHQISYFGPWGYLRGAPQGQKIKIKQKKNYIPLEILVILVVMPETQTNWIEMGLGGPDSRPENHIKLANNLL